MGTGAPNFYWEANLHQESRGEAPHGALQMLLLTWSVHEPPDIVIVSSSKKIIPILKITIASYTASFGARDRESADTKAQLFLRHCSMKPLSFPIDQPFTLIFC